MNNSQQISVLGFPTENGIDLFYVNVPNILENPLTQIKIDFIDTLGDSKTRKLFEWIVENYSSRTNRFAYATGYNPQMSIDYLNENKIQKIFLIGCKFIDSTFVSEDEPLNKVSIIIQPTRIISSQ